MKLDGHPYEADIVGQDQKDIAVTSEGYAGLAHGEHYKIKLKGSPERRTAAEISVDGEVIGNFVLPVNGTVMIERPVAVEKLLTFYKLDSAEAEQALLTNVAKNDLGLISVKFVPERDPVRRPLRGVLHMRSSGSSLGSFDNATRGLSAGGTGLSGQSSQRFTTVHFNGDETKSVTLNLRLACDPARVIGTDIAPLPGRLANSNPVPPALN